jgi:hypothetical protein
MMSRARGGPQAVVLCDRRAGRGITRDAMPDLTQTFGGDFMSPFRTRSPRGSARRETSVVSVVKSCLVRPRDVR